MRRYGMGGLTPAEVCRLVEQALVVGKLEAARDPYPAHVPVSVYLSCSTSSLDFAGGVSSGMAKHDLRLAYVAYIDGRRSAEDAGRVWCDCLLQSVRLEQAIADPPESLGAGRHELSMEVVVSLGPPSPAGYAQDRAALRSWTITRSTTIELEDQPVSHYVTPAESEDLARTVDAAFMVPPRVTGSYGPGITYHVEMPPILVAGKICARASGHIKYTWVGDLLVRPGTSFTTAAALDQVPGIRQATHVDLRIVPDAELAVQCRGAKEYYGRVIERLNVPLAREDQTSQSGSGS